MATGTGTPLAILNPGQVPPCNWQIICDIIDKVEDQREFVTISVNGPTRKGKSFLLNFILRYLVSNEVARSNGQWVNCKMSSEGFAQGPGVRPVTIGCHIWSEPFYIDQGDKKLAILLLDNQGLFDRTTSIGSNSLIFAFSCIFSSVFIYNIFNDINESDFENLAKLAGNVPDDSIIFPKLIFLIRDFQHGTEYRYGYYDDVTVPEGQDPGENFKTNIIDPSTEQHKEYRTIHDTIVSKFEKLRLYAMPRPNEIPSETPWDSLDLQFKNHMQNFVEKLFGELLVTKKFAQDQVITKQVFKELFQNFNTLTGQISFDFSNSKLSQKEVKFNECVESFLKSLNEFEKDNTASVPNSTLEDFIECTKVKSLEKMHSMFRDYETQKDKFLIKIEQFCLNFKKRNNWKLIDEDKQKKLLEQAKVIEALQLRSEEFAKKNKIYQIIHNIEKLVLMYKSAILKLEIIDSNLKGMVQKSLDELASTSFVTAASLGGIIFGTLAAPFTWGTSLAITAGGVGVLSRTMFGGSSKEREATAIAGQCSEVNQEIQVLESGTAEIRLMLAPILGLHEWLLNLGLPDQEALQLLLWAFMQGLEVPNSDDDDNGHDSKNYLLQMQNSFDVFRHFLVDHQHVQSDTNPLGEMINSWINFFTLTLGNNLTIGDNSSRNLGGTASAIRLNNGTMSTAFLRVMVPVIYLVVSLPDIYQILREPRHDHAVILKIRTVIEEFQKRVETLEGIFNFFKEI